MNLTPHFTLEELVATQHRGINNTPPADVVDRLRQTALLLEQVRMRLGVPVIVSSGYRCPELNRQVKGRPNSQHLTGQAADFIAPGFGPPSTVMSALVDSGIEYDQIIVEFGRWVHISWAPVGRRHEALVIDDTGTRPFFA